VGEDGRRAARLTIAKRSNWTALPIFIVGAVGVTFGPRHLRGWSIAALVLSGVIQIYARLMTLDRSAMSRASAKGKVADDEDSVL